MKIKINIFNVFLIICLAICSYFALNLSSAHNKTFAASEKNFFYVVSNSDFDGTHSIKITGQNVDNSQYILSENLTNFDDVFNLINQDLSLANKTFENTKITINFDDFTIYNNWQINPTKGFLSFCGNITNPSTSPVFNICAEDVNNFNLDNLVISSQGTNLINIDYSAIKLNLTINNSSFESLSSNSYAIKFDDTICDLTISGLNNHTTTYLFNYQKSLNILFENFEQSDLTVTLPSNLNNQTILNNITTIITNSFKFVPENQLYQLEGKTYWTTHKLIYTSLINLNFNLNGGLSNESLPATFVYGQNFNLPTSIKNNNYTFAGWFGSCTIDNETYYFDNNILASISDSSFNKEFLKTNLKTSLGDVLNSNKISSFYDENNASNKINSENFIRLFNSLKQIPCLIAKWDYSITINTLGGDDMSPVMCSIDSQATIPTPSKVGHSFSGWYLDQNLSIAADFDKIRTNTTIFAKWHLNNYKITFVGGNNKTETQTISYGEEIVFPNFLEVGHTISGWKTENNSPFNSNIMPAENIILFAIFEKNTYITNFENTGNEIFEPVYSKYLDPIEQPEYPTKNGYTFVEWIDKDTNLPFNFSSTPAKNSTAVAQWSANSYTATFIFGSNEIKSIKFGEVLSYIPKNPGYKLLGWYDSNDKKIETMPAHNVSLYPKWQAKNVISLTLNQQSESIDSKNLNYKLNTNLANFIIEYYVDGIWTISVPTSIGTYDIKITRMEDEEYAQYTEILPNGFRVLPQAYDLSKLILVLFVIFLIEIIFIIFTKWITKQKQNSPMFYSIILPFAMFDSNEFIIAVIALLLSIIGLIWLIKELVTLHNTTPVEGKKNDKYDNRVTINKIEDLSNDIEIEQKVEDILIKNNLIKPNKTKKQIKINTDNNDYLDIYDDKN